MDSLRFILGVSRPRFWLYVFGPYIVGLAAAAGTRSDFLSLPVTIFGLYFLLPANLLIYGVNDIFDYETDRLNRKKAGYEQIVEVDRRRELLLWIMVLNVPLLIFAAVIWPALLPALGGFIFFSVFYSAPPVRAKVVPFLDSAFNVLYVFPGIISYRMIAGGYPPATAIIAAGLWTAAMHAYSAIPDIDADREAGLDTIATVLKPFWSLVLCGVMYGLAAVLSFKYLSWLSVLLGAVYLLIVAISFNAMRKDKLFELYRLFPVVNAACGFCLFWYAALTRLFT